MYDILIVILAVIFVLGIAINIHEFGHFAVAKLLGMRVDAYSFFGLGPRIWGFKVGHTDYRISAIPLGAYVKLYGDEATGPLEGKDAQEEVVPDSELYELRPRWQKFLVMIGGPFMNIMLALAIPFAAGLIYGVPATPSPVVASVKAGGAAEQAGIQVGDRIVGFDGVENPSWERIRNDSMIAPDMQVPITVERNGQRSNLTITPTREDVKGNSVGSLDFSPAEPAVLSPQPDSIAEQAGVKRGDKVISINGETVSYDNFIGLIQKYKENPIKMVIVRNNQPQEITLQPKIGEDGKALIGTQVSNRTLDREKATVSQAAAFAVNTNLEIIRLTGRVFGQLFAGERSVKDAGVAGPIGIVQIISQVVSEQGFAGLVSILALISLNLGVFNLLPIPMLDGGQIAVLAIEGLLALFGLTLSMAVKEKIQLVGLAMILILMVAVIFFDISRIVGG
ncbi:RIP metalloprotease RseP [soil metagenome]